MFFESPLSSNKASEGCDERLRASKFIGLSKFKLFLAGFGVFSTYRGVDVLSCCFTPLTMAEACSGLSPERGSLDTRVEA